MWPLGSVGGSQLTFSDVSDVTMKYNEPGLPGTENKHTTRVSPTVSE